MKLTEVFEGLGKQMIEDFERVQSQIKHRGERGREREAALRRFLQEYLPSSYAVSQGEIVDTEGQTSHQCDLVVYDSAKCPLLLEREDYQVFPVEPVLAVVEVKSVLNKTQLKDAVHKIAGVKCLKRETGPVVGVIFAYRSAYKRDVMDKTLAALQQLNEELEPHEFADMVCVLQSGLIELLSEGYPRISGDGSEVRWLLGWPQLLWPVPLEFFIRLLRLVNAQEPTMPNYVEYVKEPGGGMATVADARLTRDPRLWEDRLYRTLSYPWYERDPAKGAEHGKEEIGT